jgi:L-aminopeptidase/D-esterase-like protein
MDPDGRLVPPEPGLSRPRESGGTTLGLVATDLLVDRPALARVIAMAHAGLASVVVPFHSATDGDVLFGASTGAAGPGPREERAGETADCLGSLAAQLLARAALGAARIANAEH